MDSKKLNAFDPPHAAQQTETEEIAKTRRSEQLASAMQDAAAEMLSQQLKKVLDGLAPVAVRIQLRDV